ncbi:MAG TPA: hypothetical protein VKG05_10870 [Steroidobacteraceae bacterium]|nr:hypothetical protein [Steroidobacteraceae bacterium]
MTAVIYRPFEAALTALSAQDVIRVVIIERFVLGCGLIMSQAKRIWWLGGDTARSAVIDAKRSRRKHRDRAALLARFAMQRLRRVIRGKVEDARP